MSRRGGHEEIRLRISGILSTMAYALVDCVSPKEEAMSSPEAVLCLQVTTLHKQVSPFVKDPSVEEFVLESLKSDNFKDLLSYRFFEICERRRLCHTDMSRYVWFLVSSWISSS